MPRYSKRNNPCRVATVDPDKLAAALERRNKRNDPYTSSAYWRDRYPIPTNRKHMPYDRDTDDYEELEN